MKIEYIPFLDLLSDIIDNRGRSCPTSKTGIPLIATNCIRNDLLYPVFENIRHVSKETMESWFRGHPESGDIIFVNKGTPGRVCLVPDPVDFCIAQDMVAIRANPKKIYPKYLFAVLRSKEVQVQIENMHVGTLIPHFKKGDFNKLLIPVPDWKTQEIIGNYYFVFSNKIELNSRMNETLEAMAQAIFKSWFVDFDPVRAKRDGKQPVGIDAETAALFPSEFEIVDGREVPKGWTVGKVSDLGAIICGKTPPTNNPENYGSDMPFITIPDMHDKIFILNSGKMLSNIGVQTQSNKILPPMSICVSCIASPGLVSLTSKPSLTNQQINSIIPLNKKSVYYCYYILKGLAAEIISSGSGGSVINNLNKGQFSSISVLRSPERIIEKYHDWVVSLFTKILLNQEEILTLITLRDSILPKLISGELDVVTGDSG